MSVDTSGIESLITAGHVNVTIDLPDNMSEANRLDMVANLAALFANAIIKDMISKDSPAY